MCVTTSACGLYEGEREREKKNESRPNELKN